MKSLIIILLLSGLCFAEEFTKDKFDAAELTKEIETATGLDLEGKNQIGYVNTSGDKIEVKLRERELSSLEKNKINDIIKTHNADKIKTDKKLAKAQKELALKTKFGWTDEDIENLKEILAD